MINALSAFALISASLMPPSQAPAWPCKLKIGIGIGCGLVDIENAQTAADLFTSFGLNQERLRSPTTTAYLNRFYCFRILDNTGSLKMVRVGVLAVPEPEETVQVVLLRIFSAGKERSAWVPMPYLDGRCPGSLADGERSQAE